VNHENCLSSVFAVKFLHPHTTPTPLVPHSAVQAASRTTCFNHWCGRASKYEGFSSATL
jgi:hypothetical protein